MITNVTDNERRLARENETLKKFIAEERMRNDLLAALMRGKNELVSDLLVEAGALAMLTLEAHSTYCCVMGRDNA